MILELKGSFSYNVTDIDESIVLSGFGTDKSTISLKDFADGMYFISILKDNKTSNVRLVKK